MTTPVRFKMNGVADLKRSFEQLGIETATTIGTAAVRKSAQVARDKVREAAPFRPGSTVKSWRRKDGSVVQADYGHLKENIRIRKERNVRRENHIVYHVTVGRAFWGRFLEFGTRFMPARPFMRPTFDANLEAIVKEMSDALRTGIERAAKRLNRRPRK